MTKITAKAIDSWLQCFSRANYSHWPLFQSVQPVLLPTTDKNTVVKMTASAVFLWRHTPYLSLSCFAPRLSGYHLFSHQVLFCLVKTVFHCVSFFFFTLGIHILFLSTFSLPDFLLFTLFSFRFYFFSLLSFPLFPPAHFSSPFPFSLRLYRTPFPSLHLSLPTFLSVHFFLFHLTLLSTSFSSTSPFYPPLNAPPFPSLPHFLLVTSFFCTFTFSSCFIFPFL